MLKIAAVALAIQTIEAKTVQNRRKLSQPPILGYYPASSVTDHNRIDLDQAALESAFGDCGEDAPSTCTGMADVKAAYEQGGYSAPQGICTTSAAVEDCNNNCDSVTTTSHKKKAALTYVGSDGVTYSKKTSATVVAGSNEIKFYYVTSSDREADADHCHIGGVESGSGALPGGCMADGGTITLDGTTYTCTTVDNTQAARTLQGFSTKAKKLMYDPDMDSCPARDTSVNYRNGCPYTSYSPYFDYYCSGNSASCNGNGGYADDIVLAAIDGTATSLSSTFGDFDPTEGSGLGRKEIIKKGTAYMNAWMYAVREFEDAIDDCTGDELDNNDMSSGSVHAWDEGVAFYTGSIMQTGYLSGAIAAPGETASTPSMLNDGIGKLAYDLGNKRCRNFATCGPDGGATNGQSQQNYKLFELFNEGQVDFRTGNCGAVVPVKNAIVQWMTVPLVQGTLRYAYEAGVANGNLKARAEGAIFALAVLPQVHECSSTHAATIKAEVVDKWVTGNIDFMAVKAAFEACYADMFPDIAAPCAAIGTYGGSAGTQDLNSGSVTTTTCTDPEPETESSSSTNTTPIIIVAAVAGVLLLCIAYICMKEKSSGKPVFFSAGAGGNSA